MTKEKSLLKLTDLQGTREFNQFPSDQGNSVICLNSERVQHVQLQVLVEETEEQVALTASLSGKDMMGDVGSNLYHSNQLLLPEYTVVDFRYIPTFERSSNLDPSLKAIATTCLKCVSPLHLGNS